VKTKNLAARRTSLFDALIEGHSFLESMGFGMNDEGNEPVFLIDYPIAIGNPFQALYNSASIEHGVIATGCNDLEEVASIRWPVNTCLHIHWLGNIIKNSENVEEAKERVNDFMALLDKMKINGLKILWTVHNTLPHDAEFVEQQVILRKGLIERCDVIHIMNDETISIASEYFDLPIDKVVSTPHCSYEGYYPDFTTRDDARHQLNLDREAFIFLFFGSIQRYKGVEEMIEAFSVLQQETDVNIKLVISGKVSDREFEEELLSLISKDNDIHYFRNKIPVDEVQYHFRSADVCICPYRATLNSGVAHLAHTFGVPVIGPDIGGFEQLLREGGGLLFKQNDAESLLDSMRESLSLDMEKTSSEISNLNAKYYPSKISNKFFDDLLAFFDWR
jgi:beta-1,4-mannosyltransferase